MESLFTQLPEGTGHIPLHCSQKGVAVADSSLAAHCSCTPCSAPTILPSLARLVPLQICVWGALSSGRQELCETKQERIDGYLWGSADADDVN